MTNWWLQMHLEMTLYHKQAIAEIFYRRNKDRGTILEVKGNAG